MIQEQTISFDKLVAALKEMNDKIGSLSYYLFALKYGKVLKNHNLTEIIRSANLTESMSKELSKGLRLYNVLTTNDFGIRLKEDNNNIIWNSQLQNAVQPSEQRESLQQIFYGAPGTGKSHTINEETKDEDVIRTTFHPDTDYSTFVGAYKPTTKEVELRDLSGHKVVENGEIVKEDRIVYEFIAQSFLQAYVSAWKKYADANEDEPQKQYLVIEEINRGNCAQIFGDLFQLLDRNDRGFSDYPIKADADMKRQLQKAFAGLLIAQKDKINAMYEGKDIVSQVLNGDILLLPNNLYIWATMNTRPEFVPNRLCFQASLGLDLYAYIQCRKGLDYRS